MTTTTIGVLAAIGRVLLAYVLARAALHKLRNRALFVAQLRAYRLLPQMLLAPVAVTLALVEASTAITLLAWNPASLMAAALFAIYGGAMAINLARGRRDLDCGCGGPHAAPVRIDWSLVVRNGALTLIALAVFVVDLGPFAPLDTLTVLAGSIALTLLFEATGQAIANRQRVLAWKESRAWKP